MLIWKDKMMREDIINFMVDEEAPFFIQMMGISYCDGSYGIRRPKSPIYCFEYVLKGKGTVNHDANTFYPGTGDIYILHKGADHLYFSDKVEPWTKIWFNIHGPVVDALMTAYGLDEINHIKGLDLSEPFNKILEYGRVMQDQKQVFSAASLVFHKMLQSINHHVQPERSNDLAHKIKALIDNTIDKNVALKDIAEEVFCTLPHAIRVFKGKYQITPYEYMLTRKIGMAKQLLKNTSMPISEVAYRLSFSDEHYFSAFFKRRTGMSPLTFRRS